jgi:hypothetical protein
MEKEKRESNEIEHAKKIKRHWCEEYREMQQIISRTPYEHVGNVGWEGAMYVADVVYNQPRQDLVDKMREHREICQPCITHFSGGVIIFVDFASGEEPAQVRS